MSKDVVRPASEFGKDHGLVHEVVVTGRKVGAGEEFWSKLAHDEELFRKAVAFVNGNGATASVAVSFDSQLRDWARFFREVRHRDMKLADLRQLQIPEAAAEFDWIIPMLKGDLPNAIFNSMSERVNPKPYKWYDDLDSGHHDRVADHSYIIRVRGRVEADEELKGLSANQLKERGVKGITLAEHLQLHDFYYWKTGEHLDKKNWSLCSGSRTPDGDVPYVGWDPGGGEVYVRTYHPDDARDGLRSRVAVSSPLPTAV